jgi:signal transduction histidine kinase
MADSPDRGDADGDAGFDPSSLGRSHNWQGLIGSMRFRILAAMVLLLAASAAVSTLVLRSSLLEGLASEIEEALRREAEELERLAAGTDPGTGQDFGNDMRAVFDEYFAREVPDLGETLFGFVDGELYLAERAPEVVPPAQLAEPIEYWLSRTERTEGLLETDAGDVRFVAVPFPDAEPEALFVVANFPVFEQGPIDDAVRTQAITQFATIVAASLLGLLLATRVLRPLRSLADTAQTITATDLTRRIPVRGADEASRIAAAFNDMLERLESVFATQRRFLDDASHELRVPLTVVRGNVEVLELEADPEERAAMIAVITNEIERMNRIVEDLLVLARAERPDFLAVEAVDLEDLTLDVYRKATVLCRRQWRLDEAARASVMVDPQRITQAMMQLAQNACQHTAEDSPVGLGSRSDRDGVVLWVQDRGPGVPPEEAEHIFDRYVRGSNRPAGSGLGLGLSIVSAIAVAHGGRARVRTLGPGARFEIVLPTRVLSETSEDLATTP